MVKKTRSVKLSDRTWDYQLPRLAKYFQVGSRTRAIEVLIEREIARVEADKMQQKTLYDIPNGIGASPIPLAETGHERLVDVPGSSCCVAGCQNEATRSVRVADERGTKGSLICFEHRQKDPNFGRTNWPHPLERKVA